MVDGMRMMIRCPFPIGCFLIGLLLVAPMVHAAGWNGADADCGTHHSSSHRDHDRQEGDAAKTGHYHCGCQHLPLPEATVESARRLMLRQIPSAQSTEREPDSLTVLPLQEPPSLV